MITIKVMLRVLVFSLVFTMLATHQAWGRNKENSEKRIKISLSANAKTALQSAVKPVQTNYAAML